MYWFLLGTSLSYKYGNQDTEKENNVQGHPESQRWDWGEDESLLTSSYLVYPDTTSAYSNDPLSSLCPHPPSIKTYLC